MDALTSRAVSGQQCSTSYTKSTLLRSPHSIGRQHRTQRGPIQVDQPQGSFALQHRQDSANRPRHSLLRLQSKQHRHVYVRSSSALGSPEPADKSPEQGQSASGGDDQLQGTDSSSKGSEEQDLWSRLSRILLVGKESALKLAGGWTWLILLPSIPQRSDIDCIACVQGNQEPPTVPWDIGKVFQVRHLCRRAASMLPWFAIASVHCMLLLHKTEHIDN